MEMKFVAACAVAGLLFICSFAASAIPTSTIDFKGNPIGDKVISWEKKNIVDDIYEYTFILSVGKGEFDRIGVHRVVKEASSLKPASSAVMMVHGDTSDFDSTFLMSARSDKVSKNYSLGAYLAENGIDIWGIDLRWALVQSCSDGCNFMANWNNKTNLDDIKTAVKFSRVVRELTDNESGKIFLLGHSGGSNYCYAYVDNETQVIDSARDIKGMISLDMAYRLDPNETALIKNAKDRYYALKSLRDSGKHFSDDALTLKLIASLAASDPDNMSLAVPGFTNRQAALLVLSATQSTYKPPISPPTPFYHYCAGSFDNNSMPLGLAFTDFGYMTNFAIAVPSYENMNDLIDVEAKMAGIYDSQSSHLAQVIVPVLYIGAAGGFGGYGNYSVSLLGSEDKSIRIIRLLPPGYEAADFGHIDLLYANNAKSMVWEPISNWIKSR